MIRKETWGAYMEIIEELGYPPAYLIDHEQFAMIDGEEHRSENMVGNLVAGIASNTYYVFAIHPWLEGKERKNVIYHEIAHILWPWRSHWWIECFAEKMARGGGRGFYSKLYGHSPKELPPRKKLLYLARRQSKRITRRRIKEIIETKARLEV